MRTQASVFIARLGRRPRASLDARLDGAHGFFIAAMCSDTPSVFRISGDVCAYRIIPFVTLRPPNGRQNTSVCAFLTRGLEDSRKIVCLQRSPTIRMLMPGRMRTVLEAITELGGIVRWTGSASRGAEFKRRAAHTGDEARQLGRTATTAPRSAGCTGLGSGASLPSDRCVRVS